MLNFIIRTALQNRLVVLTIACGMLVLGVMRSRELAIDVLPDLTRPRVVLLTECPGLAPEEVESLVTFPLETAVNGATGVTRVRSDSAIGLSVIYVDFDWDQDVFIARNIVQERIATVLDDLPEGIQPQMGPMSSLLGQIMLVGIWSEDGSTGPLELRTLADWTIRQRLRTIKGVAQVIAMGGGKMQYQVLVNPHRLHQYDVSLHELETALQEGNLNVSGGYLRQGGLDVVARGIGRVQTVADIEQIVVKPRPSRSVLVRDIATVVKRAQVKRGDAAVNGKDAVVLTIQKQPGFDTREVSDQIRRALAEQASGLPKDVRVEVTYEQRTFIDYSISNVMNAIRDGAVMVVVVLLLFLMNIRITTLTLTVIPLSILTTAIVFHIFQLSINVMTLGGIAIALGELVDDAIVDVENIFRRLRENRLLDEPSPTLEVIYAASSEVRKAIMMSTVMVVLTFIPLFALTGMKGRLFAPLGVAYIVAIISSTIVSLTVTPALSSYLLNANRATERRDGFVVRLLKLLFKPLVQLSLTRAGLLVCVGACLLSVAGAGLLLTKMGGSFLPPFDEGAAQVNLYLQPGTSLETSTKVRQIADRKLQDLVRSDDDPDAPLVWFTSKTGRAENDEHVVGVHVTEYVISLNPKSRLTRSELIEVLSTKLQDIKGATSEVEQPIIHLISHMISGVTAPIALKVFGDDLEELVKLGEQIKTKLSDIDLIRPPVVEPLRFVKQFRIEIKRGQLAAYGLTSGDVLHVMETALKGRVVSSVLIGQRSFDMLLRFEDEFRQDIQSLDRTPIELHDGSSIPLSEVATVRPSSGPSEIKREGTRRRIVVRINPIGSDMATAVDAIERKLDAEVELPTGYSMVLSGQFEESRSARQRLLLFGMLAVVGIYVVLFANFGSVSIVLQILTALPIAFVGGVLALALTDQNLSVSAMVGFISLGGIAARNGILLIETYQRKMEDGPLTKAMLVEGSLERLSPVLMTALTTGIALLPLVVGGHLPGREIVLPVATVIIGGLITSTFAEFLLRPGMFWWSQNRESQPNDTNSESP